MNPQEYALIVAGGKGTRIKNSLPKQFIELNGIPILIHTLQAFYRYSPTLSIVLVLAEDDFETWNSLVVRYRFTKPVILQKGGETRFQSVRNGLAKIDGDGLVAIHDGVRPLVSENIIAASFQLAAVQKTAVAAIRLKESIRMTDKDSLSDDSSDSKKTPLPEGIARRQDISKSMDRSLFRLIQTPQTFDVQLIKKAYQMNESPSLTDDASVAERAGHVISLFEGSYENIKITTPEDLIIAEALLRARS